MRRTTFLLGLLAAPAYAGPPKAAGPCAGRKGCSVAAKFDAGKDAQGKPLTVARVALDPRDKGGSEPPDADTSRCVPYEWWLLRGPEARPLLALCNDGYGAAGVGSDDVKVGPNRLEYAQSGGSSWRWTNTRVLQLSPPRLLSTADDGAWTLGPNTSHCDWDRATWQGTCTWSAPKCDAKGEPESTEMGSGPTYAFRRLPAPTLPPEWRSAAWRTTALGSCAADAAYTVHGAAGAPADARLRAVLGPQGELYVEIEDDVWKHGAKDWLNDDHVEIWTGKAAGYMDNCLDRGEKPAQWAIGVLDDQVRPAYGAPKALPTVERQVVGGDKPTRVRLEIRLPQVPEALTVVYSDSDDGKSQERLIATSDLRFGDRATLGQPYPVPATDAVCAIDAGRLDFRDTWKPPAKGPLLGDAQEP
jgi:hypothetical protein